ncbi:MAG: uncharacterized protein QOI59_3766 [Gammaproteobacteria bacterium]|jgi:hypothetical protein|nr:uncharacterized protein [Gammaproteobacteria bacterium]
MFAVLLSVTALVAMAAKPAATTAVGTAVAHISSSLASSSLEPGHKAGPPKSGRVLDLDWKELLPEGERSRFTAVAPAPVHDYRGEGGPPAVQAQDFNVNKSLEGATVRLPGFIVPLEAVKSGDVSEFLLVPYFGSCIHVPPPPPNQIVYVHTGKRPGIESIYDAYWITGKLHLQTKSTRLGSTAYELSAEKIEVYKY